MTKYRYIACRLSPVACRFQCSAHEEVFCLNGTRPITNQPFVSQINDMYVNLCTLHDDTSNANLIWTDFSIHCDIINTKHCPKPNAKHNSNDRSSPSALPVLSLNPTGCLSPSNFCVMASQVIRSVGSTQYLQNDIGSVCMDGETFTFTVFVANGDKQIAPFIG